MGDWSIKWTTKLIPTVTILGRPFGRSPRVVRQVGLTQIRCWRSICKSLDSADILCRKNGNYSTCLTGDKNMSVPSANLVSRHEVFSTNSPNLQGFLLLRTPSFCPSSWGIQVQQKWHLQPQLFACCKWQWLVIHSIFLLGWQHWQTSGSLGFVHTG